MSDTYNFQIARADAAAVEAKEASLENAKQRALRSEIAWRGMAQRTLKMEQEREKTRVERERRNAELAGGQEAST
ncbi:hypothetical protein GRI48_10555 [Altererythrobacter oceanensis]|uniref:Uncharacterized protein n=2 Tax=Qipengyuania oceanensis TaxID=1463597 RepID=A0A844YHS8_9SPHN|nr:hypothetical protein [Qipengyuania oceanensis]